MAAGGPGRGARALLGAVGLLLALLAGPARAELTIQITRGAEGALPIAVVPFGTAGPPPPVDVAQVIADDLRRSGRFAPLDRRDMISRPHTGGEVRFRDWRLLDVGSLVVGRVLADGAGYRVQFQLFDVFRGVQLAGYSIPTDARHLRRTAHQIADIVYETLTGEPGAFATRIAYVIVTREGGARRYSLMVADADGHDPQPVLRSRQPILSPAWSPDGRRLAYVSFEGGRSKVYVQELATGRREVVAAYPGLNSAPAWSPDGRRLALTLSKDGNAEIYVLELATRALRRLTHSLAIDTEPAWSPDGRSIVFTSDRGGGPQLYRVPAQGGRPVRLTFEGGYNARAAFSPDGRHLAFVHRAQGRYRIALMDLEEGTLQLLSDGPLDESPSFAPNGSMILYATQRAGRGILAAVSVDGRVRQRLSSPEGDAREPAWSPFRR
ncbi:MAG: Tol-Pal system beta propeller repeat protein TolB [Gammaproteobacteria bacterium]|nr:MAG: Tol-Pal system beta propeller repeat protein TolB [Gammaproteobacteria bacterium]